jgi:hypothetical protein
MTGDIPEGGTILANHNAGFLCFDKHFTRIGVKKDIGDTCGLRYNGFDLVICLFRIF